MDKVLYESLEGFLDAIVREYGANDHAWLTRCARDNLAALQEFQAALKVSAWTREQVVAALLSDLWRVLDAGGLSHGRSLQSDLLEPALALMHLYRPPGDITEWPDRRTVLQRAKELLQTDET